MLIGKACLKLFTRIVEENKKKPAFSFFPENFYPVPRTLFLILIVSFLLNVYGISWGLPDYRGWATDELIPLAVHLSMEQGVYHGWNTKYPPFHYYLLIVSSLPFFILDRLNVIDIHSFFIYNVLFYLGRFISVLMGIATVFITYLCGSEIYEKRASLFTALITSLIAPFLYYSKLTYLDTPYIFWFVLSLFFYIRILKHHRLADYLLFSTTATISICTKDQAYGFYILIPIGVVLSHYLYERRRNTSAKMIHSLFNRNTMLSLLLAITLFIVIHNILFNISGFLNHVRLIIGQGIEPYKMYENTIVDHARILWQSLKYLRFSFGWPVYLTCIAGIVMALFQKKKNTLLFWILIPGISYYLFFISIIPYLHVRFFMPICILLAFFGGKCFSDFLNATQRFYKVKIVVVSVIFMHTFFYAASVDILMDKDSRYYVEAWMEQNIDENSSIGLVDMVEYLPRVTKFKQRKNISRAFFQAVEHLKPDYLIVNSNIRFREEEFYTQLNYEKLGYRLVLQYWSNPKIALLNHRNIYKDGKKDIATNLDEINPEIKIFKRIN